MTKRRPKLTWEQRIAEARQQGLGWGEYLFRKGLLPIEGPLPASQDAIELMSIIKLREHDTFHQSILHGYVAAAHKAGLTTDGVERRSTR
jgi:hypothetical protein